MLNHNHVKQALKSAYTGILGYHAYNRNALSEKQQKQWQEDGFLVLPSFFSDSETESLNQYIDRLWDKTPAEVERLVIDVFIGTSGERRLSMKNAPTEARRAPYKLNDLYLESAEVRNLALSLPLVSIVGALMGGAPLLCNSLSLEFGSQQEFHTDSLYMSPPKDLNLTATWVALEDCRPDAGPLRYYPKSHLIPPYRFSSGKLRAVPQEMDAYRSYMQKQVAERGLSESRFCAKKGDVFIWHGQLFHGGAPIENSRLTRRSLVCHYYLAQDIATVHGKVGPGQFYLKRSHAEI